MRHSTRQSTGLAAVAAVAMLAVSAATPAEARCTRLGFSVNDYGKDGPIKDAKALLDKYVAKWAGDHGIKTFTIGKKDVSCELFLDLLLFDEHTCKASATVCWPDGQGPTTYAIEKAEGGVAPAVKKATPVKAKAAAAAPAPAAGPAVVAPAAAAPAAAAPTAPVEAKAKE